MTTEQEVAPVETPADAAPPLMHDLCSTCYPDHHLPDGERFALCGTDMADELDVPPTENRCHVCADLARTHRHGPRY